jgi:hypothetical protein
VNIEVKAVFGSDCTPDYQWKNENPAKRSAVQSILKAAVLYRITEIAYSRRFSKCESHLAFFRTRVPPNVFPPVPPTFVLALASPQAACRRPARRLPCSPSRRPAWR